ncbi:response regulator transcription factor [Flavobacterium aquatile]|uniref:Transcriptional regulator n=1 Tax=Flavobacterium aquatile LMG 4008 = ATCC 11947 TaxID=1453498 RepID=A0A095SXU9_9FLAO|nr:response regulator transcription factor [Flavobacterium aquatile]KGD69159.1 transcriptional regulator [Flavobacterium aquatile LMG 4008 = ATCC 11947]OXA65868.1 DNA-binding response regulator [Flavobacterium aquatile LMG 4008 = ATCC 11947]GEC79675.1 DNA-binding response regulator [Flavobacterium aquatile]
MKKLLLAEDDLDLSTVLIQYLQLHNFELSWAENGAKALELFQKNTFDICILDVMMPVMDGFTLAEELIKINPETPFIFLTAKSMMEDKIKGLQLGADDYIVKPFEVEELILRLNNILKRSESNSKMNIQEIKIGKYLFDTKRMCLKLENKTQQLTEKEAALIHFLYNNRNQLVKREAILKAVWKTDDYFSGRSMDVFITKIRKYFQDDARITIESTRFIGLEFKISE